MTPEEQTADGTWWSRPAGGREVLRMALPLVASMLSWTLMSFIDRMILHWVSGPAMSAAFSAQVAWFAGMSLAFGICSYVGTFVSQYHGDGQPERIGPIAWQGVWLAVACTPLAWAGAALAPWLFSLAQHEPELTRLETQFFQILCWAAPAFLAALALEAFYSGRGRTWVVMCVDMAAVVVNLVLACVLVLGLGGIAPWGMPGAAWATVAAQWFRVAAYLLLFTSPKNRREFNTVSGIGLNGDLLWRLLRFGGPSGVQMLLDVGGFTVFVMLVGRLGKVEAEATTLAFSIGQLAFMPVWGFGIATSILVGQRLGEDRSDLARRAAWTSLTIALAYMGFISAMFVAAPQLFLSIFFSHSTEAIAASTMARDMTATLLIFCAAYNLLDATLIIFVSVLKGAGDTRFVMVVSVVMAAVLAGATWIAVVVAKLGIYSCWTIITVWVWALGLTYLVRFLQGRWQAMRVIEQVHHHGEAEALAQPSVNGDGALASAPALLE